jgi:hypothetical protein
MSGHSGWDVDDVRLQTDPGIPIAQEELRASTEASVVLSSLARAAVRSFAESCTLELSEGVEPVLRVTYPANDSPSPGPAGLVPARADERRVVVTPFDLPAASGYPACTGVLVFAWATGAPDDARAVVARLLVEAALAVIRYERLAEAADEAQRRSSQLAADALARRSIGEAVGLVRATRQLDGSAALGLIRAASRSSGRDLYEVAVEVVHAGGLMITPSERVGVRDGHG